MLHITKFSSRSLALFLVVAQVLFPIGADAGISQLPPLVKPNVPPNVFYTLDDSGSMMFEVMPETLTPYGDIRDTAGGGVAGKDWTTTGTMNYCKGGGCWVTQTFPPQANMYSPSGAYGAANSVSVGFEDNITVARWRASVMNKIYYDPAVRYDPWVDPAKIDTNNPYGLPMAAASKTAAKYNPVAPTGGSNASTINLTVNNTVTAAWLNAAATTWSSTSKTFYPATYYVFSPRATALGSYPACIGANAGNYSNLNCYTRIEVRSVAGPFTPTYFTKATGRTDCKTSGPGAIGVCSYEEEIQNFANWFQYYRSRILMARGGSAAAFALQASNLRVGFGTINTTGTVFRRISDDFSDANKKDFLSTLYSKPVNPAGTPLVKAVDEVGQYFMDKVTAYKNANSPWQTKYGVAGAQAACRQSYNILMTDGYWNGSNAANAPGDWDGKAGTTISRPSGSSYTYSPAKPYADSLNSNTLADIAFYYWVNDLRTLSNIVPPSRDGSDPAFWQHLVQFTVGLGVDGTLNSKTDLPDLTSGVKKWPNPTTSDLHKVDDLWHAAVNTRGKYFSASNPVEFADALKQALNEIGARSGDAAAVATSNNTLGSDLKLYTATYRTGDWSGRLEQKAVYYNDTNPTDPANGSISPTNDWDTDLLKVDHLTRNIVTSNYPSGPSVPGIGGHDFKFEQLNAVHQGVFNAAAGLYTSTKPVTGTSILNFIRGESDEELPFRNRLYWLGDLVNSDPQYVREGRDDGYNFLPSGAIGKEQYLAFLNAKKSRQGAVYVGSNDGMLHAFDAGKKSIKGTGKELFAFVPNAVIANLPELAKPNYVHRFFVDGTPNIGDAAIGAGSSPWRSVLVAGAGAGAKSVFALDVTDPATFTKDNVLWELSAVGDNDLGFTIGVPQIGVLKDGTWVAVFGNGFSSINGVAKLYVVDLKDGKVLHRVSTEVGSPGSPNGLSTPKLLISPDATIAGVYAGDMQGNLWKFDFKTESNKTTPELGISKKPLFVATHNKDKSGRRQPITTQPQIYPHPLEGNMIVFGTGRIFDDSDASSIEAETLYGVWDKAVSTEVLKTTLQEQELAIVDSIYYSVTKYVVDWAVHRGWFISLKPRAGERLITDPNIFEDMVIFTTLIPGTSSDPCTNDGLSATIQVSPLNGAALGYKTIDKDNNGVVNKDDGMVSGKIGPATFGTTLIRTGNRNLKLYQAPSSGEPPKADSSRGGDLIPTARLWRQLLGRP